MCSFIRDHSFNLAHRPGNSCSSVLPLPHHERITVTNGSAAWSQIWVLVQLCDLVLAP